MNVDQELVAAALEARRRAYAPYSKFSVGAALRGIDGRLYTGCNVENASYGLTMCGERVALANAVASGATQFTAMAIASRGGVTPCGACRQVLAEFAPDLAIFLVDADATSDRAMASLVATSLSVLLPSQFTLKRSS